jgi:soluble lytic murein transglycosylase-like protein
MAERPAAKKRKRFVTRVVLGVLLYVLTVNFAVRRHGGDTNPLSFLRLYDKSTALARLGLHSVKHLWSKACLDTAPYVIEAARSEGVPVSFALAIARAESGMRSHSISSTGAMGVMQLMPSTAAAHGVFDPFDPEDNARGASRYIAELWRRYRGDRMRIAAAYNAGSSGVPLRGPLRVPSTTMSYATTVVKHDRRALMPVVRLTTPIVIQASGEHAF